MQIFLNYYKDNKSDITYQYVVGRPDLVMTKPIFVTEEELERVKSMTIEQIYDLLNKHKI